ncbi:MAG: hypothetical protein Kow006_14380 [Gammaproteobacteria bacterium]
MKFRPRTLLAVVTVGAILTLSHTAHGDADNRGGGGTEEREGLPAEMRLTPAQEAHISPHLNAARRIALNEMAEILRRTPEVSRIARQWRSLLRSFAQLPPERDLDALITWMLRAAFLEADREVQAYEQQVEEFDEAQSGYLKEAERAYRWVERHRAAGNGKIDPPFVPDHRLKRPKPILGPRPPAITRTLGTLNEVNGYALGLEQRRARLLQERQLAELAFRRAVERQQRLVEEAPGIRRALLRQAQG